MLVAVVVVGPAEVAISLQVELELEGPRVWQQELVWEPGVLGLLEPGSAGAEKV